MEEAGELDMLDRARDAAMKEEKIRIAKANGTYVEKVKKHAQLISEGLEDDDTLHDRAQEQARAWDAWKDDNVKGSGNTKRI